VADRIDYYRGYEIAYYYLGREKVRIDIREKGGLPPIHGSSQENSLPAAERRARELIDRKLAERTSN
jgi:hypothetical protein